MSASESDFKPAHDSPESSAEEEPQSRSRGTSSAPSALSRKRRRQSGSSAGDSIRGASSGPDVRYHLQGHYKDEYRVLFNDTVHSAAARFNLDDSILHKKVQIGTSIWSPEEKAMFFAALERLGKDDTPGIAKAIGTKSIPEVRQFSLLLADSAVEQGYTDVTLRDVPAAAEIGAECNARLELAGDALAWFQERFEAKKEQERFGKYWLLTPEIAEEIEAALPSSRQPSVASTAPPGSDNEEDIKTADDSVTVPQILQDIPEANILIPMNLLKLSSELFMNGSASPPSWYPHWSTLVSPLASTPSIYRTALVDFHALVISLTRRLVQTAIIQANSRIRSQGWRVKKGVSPLVKKRDAYTAIDMLRLPRNGAERWGRVARRCGLRVFDGVGKSKREVDWNEVEEDSRFSRKSTEALNTDEETPGLASEPDDDFKSRAVRSGTPLPSRASMHTDSDREEGSDGGDEGEGSDAESTQSDQSDGTTLSSSGSAQNFGDADEPDEHILENIDHNASKSEERRLWDIVGNPFPTTERASVKAEEEELEEVKSERYGTRVAVEPDWRTWTEYHAEWEQFPMPVPTALFKSNQRNRSPAPLPPNSIDIETGQSSGAEGLHGGSRRKRRKVRETEIPIRGARAYAALQDRMSGSEERNTGPENSENDADVPAPSVEDASAGMFRAVSPSDDDIEWDTKPSIET